jgi:hypothetical protein
MPLKTKDESMKDSNKHRETAAVVRFNVMT